MTLQLYNSLTRKAETFTPLKKKKAGLYTCGPTVYNYAHIGNLRTYLFEDTLKRVLIANGYKVKHVMNVTDVGHLTSDADEGEDKMEKGARRENKTAWEIADFYLTAFKNDLAELNILPADKMPRATDHIKAQIKLIKKLEKKGFTYATADGIYFDTAKLPNYGAIANLKKQELRAGVRVDVGDKKNITDFALWKFSPKLEKRQMEWKSPWGVGFPGWHIECSAMAKEFLGQPFDIHCGGIDHIPVHHANEISQSEAAEGTKLANYWLHGEFLVIPGGEKMAKAGDNFITLQTLKEKGISPLAYRFFCLQTHYRRQLKFSWEALQAAQTGLHRLYEMAWNLKNISGEKEKIEEDKKQKFEEIINNDLNMPEAIGLLHIYLRDPANFNFATLINFDNILGLDIKKNVEEFDKKFKDTILPDNIEFIRKERDTARAAKDWQKSDELRKKLEDLGYEVKDGKDGTTVNKK